MSPGASSVYERRAIHTSKALRIAIPHVCLLLVLFVYVCVGASMFGALERPHDLRFMARKSDRIVRAYHRIQSIVRTQCVDNGQTFTDEHRVTLNSLLVQLSEAHEHRSLHYINRRRALNLTEAVPARWHILESTLYSMSLLTTAGYSTRQPESHVVQLLSVFYGLIGIPLTVLVAADFGRFFSDSLVLTYDWLLARIRHCACRRNRVESDAEATADNTVVETTTAQNRRKSLGRTLSVKLRNIKPAKTKTPANSITPRKSPTTSDTTELPVLLVLLFLILVVFSGGLFYQRFNRASTLIEAIFVSFNIVTSMSSPDLSETATGVVYVFGFSVLGLSLLTMAADLAATQVLGLFRKLHYFGRKIATKQQWEKVPADELKAALFSIEQLRARDPTKYPITQEDVLRFIKHQKSITKQQQSPPKVQETTADGLHYMDDEEELAAML